MSNSIKVRRYVVAVSGGVDSAVLLDILSKWTGVRLTVAHYDHGIRGDSKSDRIFVESLARKYGLPFVFDEGHLGKNASEALARDARYTFLRRIKQITEAAAIVTAHHEDDLLETAILNLLRGTGRRGLSSLQSSGDMLRPLLGVPKANIIAYARAQDLNWHEDSTNEDTSYLRNYVRLRLLPKFDTDSRKQLRDLIENAKLTNNVLDDLLALALKQQLTANTLDRRWFIRLPHSVSREVIVAWLRAQGITDFDRKTIERIVTKAKTLPSGKRIDINSGYVIEVKQDMLALAQHDR